MNRLIKRLRRIYNAINMYLCERQKNGVKFIFKNNHSDKLIIIFSGIGGDYNYRRSLQNSTYDQLYIKDSWADGVSYYMYENGANHPEQLVSSFIIKFLEAYEYSKVITLGSSKGGSAAVYFGIKHRVDEIYTGACQYKVGNYLGVYQTEQGHDYFRKVMGDTPLNAGIDMLNDAFSKMIEKNKNSKTLVHLIYSTEEHTYSDDIVHLIQKFDECGIQHIDQIETFPEHNMIGNYMKVICQNELV